MKAYAEGYVYEYNVSPENLDLIMMEKEVVQITEEETGLNIRIFSLEKEVDAMPVAPRLVDGYLAIVKGVK